MTGILLGLLVSLLLLALPVALMVWIVRSRGQPEDEPGVGWSLRRFLQYSFLLAALFTGGAGLHRLVEVALPAGERLVGRGSAELALGLSLAIVGVPAYGALWRLVRRHLLGDPAERASLAWSLYLTVAGTVTLLMAYVGLVEVGTWLLGAEDFRPAALASGLVWGSIWALHVWMLGHPQLAPTGRAAGLAGLAGSAVGLVAVTVAVAGVLSFGLEQLYRAVAGGALVEGPATEALRRNLVRVVLAGGIWWWYWLRGTLRAPRTTLWHAYLMLLPILGGLLVAVSSGAAVLHAVLQWFLGVPDTARAAAHFDLLPGALAAGVVGGWAWWYHRTVLGEGPERRQTEPDRVYRYLAAGVGLVAAASGVTVALVALIQALAPAPLAGPDPEGRNTLVAAATLLVVGGPLWWAFWRPLQERVRREGDPERRSPSRRAYLFLLFGAAGLTALISLIVILFVFLRELLEGTLRGTVLYDLRTALALVLTAGAVSAYHWAVYREDRAERAERAGPGRAVLLVGPEDPGLAERVAERTGSMVRHLPRLDAEPAPVDPERVVAAILAAGAGRLLVVVEADGEVRAIPYRAG